MKNIIFLTRSDQDNQIMRNNILQNKISLDFEVNIDNTEFLFSNLIHYQDKKLDFSSVDFSKYKFIIITSKYAAKIISNNFTYFTNHNFLVVGEYSAKILTNCNLQVKGIFDSAALLKNQINAFNTDQFLYFSANNITLEFPKNVKRIVIYNSFYRQNLSESTLEKFNSLSMNQNINIGVFLYSLNSAKTFVTLVKKHKLTPYIERAYFYVISEKIRDYARQYYASVKLI